MRRQPGWNESERATFRVWWAVWAVWSVAMAVYLALGQLGLWLEDSLNPFLYSGYLALMNLATYCVLRYRRSDREDDD